MRLNLFMLTLLSFAFFNEVNSQWAVKHVDESSSYYDNVIKFKNDSMGFFMGNNSIILKSVDAGETWNSMDIKTQINAKDFQFIDDSVIYAVGDYYVGAGQHMMSKIIKSIDNGDTWDSIYSIDRKQLNSIWFFNNDSGIVAGFDGIYRTRDSGNSWDTVWSIIQFGYKYGTLEEISFPVPQIGYAIGEGRTHLNTSHLFDHFLLKTYNSGLTWDTIKTFPYHLTAIQFINRDTGFIGTESNPTTILKTIDGGNTWSVIHVTAEYFSYSVNSIHFISDMKGYATGAPSAMIPEGPTFFFISETMNGGDSWETYDTIGIPLNSIFFINDTVGFVSGAYNLIMKSNGRINGLPEDYPWYLNLIGDYIDENKMPDSHTEIYPNPTDGMIRIQQKGGLQPVKSIKLLTLAGRLIHVLEPASNHALMQIDLTGLPPGMYLIQVTYPDKNELLKVLKK
jgi:photosystem II stability/assembly factor-like uncharacterized protein